MKEDFHKREVRETTRQLTQDEESPPLGVHVMSETIYCHRAGLITVESQTEDFGSEFIPAPALGGLPTHEVDGLEAELELLARTLGQIAVLFLAVLIVIAGVAILRPFLALFLLLGTLAGGALAGRLGLWASIKTYWDCRRRLREAQRAAKREPNWELNAQQEVYWWGLIQSGWDSRDCKESLYKADINLRGRPWRILQRGDKRLPVIRIHAPADDSGQVMQVRLREQQRARIAAYAYLIETCEHGQADWAIVLFGRFYVGLAVPLGPHDWRAFREGLVEARAEARKRRENPRYRPDPPSDRRPCVRCPLGRPRRLGRESTVLAGQPLPAFATSDREGRQKFHSTCGDRFQDVPPHEDARALGLLE